MTTPEIRNTLSVLSQTVNDLVSTFDVGFVPVLDPISTDWLTYLKSPSYNPNIFNTDLASFQTWLANANNFLALKNDSVAYPIVRGNLTAITAFFSSPCVGLLPTRDVLIPTFNNESMTGYVYIVAYRAYPVTDYYPTLYWRLQIRATNQILLSVPYNNGLNTVFQKVGFFMPKQKLGQWYTGAGGYAYEDSAYVRVIDG